MSYLRCQECGRTIYSDYDRDIGLPCKVRGCTGVMEFVGGHTVYISSSPHLDLQCRECFHICSSDISGKKIGDPCQVKGCWGRLDRYYG